MKNILKSILFIAVLAVSASCNTDSIDYPDRHKVADGKPSVISIRYADQDSYLTQAYLGEVLCLLGNNLRSVTEIWFNDQKAVLNTSYITENTLIVAVPKTYPTVKTDKLYLINKGAVDTVAVDFKVLAPAPAPLTMSNEWAAIGEEVTIKGDYLIDDPAVPFEIAFVGADVPHADMTFTGTSAVTFHVPAGAQPGYITLTSASGSSTSKFQYRDSRGLLFDFDGVTGLGNHGWHNQTITTDATAISGNFLQLGDGIATLAGTGTWDDTHYSFEYWPGNWEDPETFTAPDGVRLNDLVDFSKFSSMAYKFEMFIPSSNPWKSNAMQIIAAGTNLVHYGAEGALDLKGNALPGCNNKYISGDDGYKTAPRALYRPWVDTGSYDTGDKWVTVVIPMTDIKYDANGKDPMAPLNVDAFASLTIFVSGGGVDGEDCQPIIKIDNVRAVPYK